MSTTRTRRDVLGQSALRPDGAAKVRGEFAFSSDMWAEGMLWGATLRSPHPYARIISIDTSAALLVPGVSAVLTADDVPGQLTYGLISEDQPVFARGFVRYMGEPVAAVAADHPETCRRALAAITVEYEVLTPLHDPEKALDPAVPPVHPDGNVFRTQRIVHGDPSVRGDVTVEGTYVIGMQDQAFLGTEAALAIPDHDGGGVEVYVATQWLHEDQKQMAKCLGLPADKVRLTLGGVGGAFGAREDISLQVHTALLALRTGRPVKMQYGREESFFGHVHRHPATVWMRHHATSDGRIVNIEARFVFDGGAYASTSSAVLINGVTHTQGPYKCPNAIVEGHAVRTNNPPCGAMRGFGVVQACYAHESQMEKLAQALGMSPVDVRLANAMETGDRLITGQVMDSVAPVAECIRQTDAIPLPPPLADDPHELELPGGSGLTARRRHVKRGIGWGVSIKNIMYSEGFDDFATARCTLQDGVATLKFATSEVGQGFVTLAPQIARSVLGVDDVILDTIDTGVGSAGSTSASRQTWMSGGAVKGACVLVRDALLAHVAATHGLDASGLSIVDTEIVNAAGTLRLPVADASAGIRLDET
ncbi:MAG: molybdopterin cofactor-binding domain-containing protein, partial [Actinomycetes bacterium]